MRPSLLFVAVLAGTILNGQPPDPTEPYRVGGSVRPPRVVYSVNPEYTKEALDARRQGQVLIELVVTRDGMPSEVHEISQQLGFGLDQKAIEAVKQWRFDPGKKSGYPVAVKEQVTLRFRLPN
jgi:protein TonB